MNADGRGLTRRDLFRAAGVAAGGGAATALVASSGCASLPRVGRGDGGHPCDSHYCRYYRADGGGRCALALREAGGLP